MGKKFDWKANGHGKPLAIDEDSTKIVCQGKAKCLVVTIELLPCPNEVTENARAHIRADVIDCETAKKKPKILDTLLDQTVECGGPDDPGSDATRTTDCELACGEHSYFEIEIEYGAMAECLRREGENVSTAGSVRVRFGTIRRKTRR